MVSKVNCLKSKRTNFISGMVLSGICVFLTAVSVYLCFSQDIWYDELFTVGLAESSWRDLLAIAARDVHPPLYYLIVKAVLEMVKTLGGTADPVIAAKCVSVLPFVLLLVYGVTRVRKYFGMLTAGIFVFLVFTMPQMSQYTVEIRMYSFCLFFITAGVLHAYEITRAEAEKSQYREWIWVTLYLLAAAYTHYFAFFAAVLVYLALFLWLIYEKCTKKHWTAFGISVGAAVAAYLPWLAAVLRQVGAVKENYWILPLTWRSIGGCVKFLFKPSFSNDRFNSVLAVLLFILFAAVISWAIWTGRKQAGNQLLLVYAGLGILAGVVIFGFVASFLLRPIFIYRYMLPAMGVFWLAFAIALGRLIGEKPFCYVILVLFLIVGLRDYRAFYGEEMWKQVQMQAAGEVLKQIKPADILIFNFNHTQGVTSYYLPNETFLYEDMPEELIREMFPRVQGMGGEEDIRKWLAAGKTVWFLGSGNAREELRVKWADAGIQSAEEASCLIERYWFNLYQLYQ